MDELRQLLHGDVALDGWPPEAGADPGEPWRTFVLARDALGAGRTDEAINRWLAIARAGDVESRQTLQAWTFLRAHGVAPEAAEAHIVHGVLCEVAVDGGHDVLAAYRDGSARYLNVSGRVVVAEPDAGATRAAVAGVITAAAPLARVIGLWDQPVLPELPAGHDRLLLLTPGGFRFGQGPHQALWQQPAAAGIFDAAVRLLSLLTELAGG